MEHDNIITVLNTKAQENLAEKVKSEVLEGDPPNAEEAIRENTKVEE